MRHERLPQDKKVQPKHWQCQQNMKHRRGEQGRGVLRCEMASPGLTEPHRAEMIGFMHSDDVSFQKHVSNVVVQAIIGPKRCIRWEQRGVLPTRQQSINGRVCGQHI